MVTWRRTPDFRPACAAQCIIDSTHANVEKLREAAADIFDTMDRDGSGSLGMDELRDYGVGAQILAELGVHDMVLLTNSQHSLVALDGYDLAVVGQRSITV